MPTLFGMILGRRWPAGIAGLQVNTVESHGLFEGIPGSHPLPQLYVAARLVKPSLDRQGLNGQDAFEMRQ